MRRTPLIAILAPLAIAACDSGSEPRVPASIDIADEVDVLLVGQTWLLDILVLDEDGDPIQDPDLDFDSDDPSVATVNGDGVVTGVGEGLANITASAGGVSDEVALAFVDAGDDPCVSALAIGFDQPVRSSLQAGDCRLQDRSYLDFWFFELDETAVVEIRMVSTASGLGTTLWLFNETDPDRIAEDEGGPTAPLSEIEIELGPGIYFIAALGWPDQTGTYTLTVDGAVLVARAALRSGDRTVARPVRALPAAPATARR